MLDVFKTDAFSLLKLTAAVNELTYVPGRLGQMGLFQAEGVDTLTIAIESIAGVLKLVDTTQRGGPGKQYTPAKRTMRDFRLAHIQVDDHLNADEVQGVRQFGSDNQLEAIQTKVNNRFNGMFSDIDATIEHLRMGAVKGIILDADGSTTLWNLFTEFGVTADAAVDFVLGTSTTNIKTLCQTVVRREMDILGATPMGRVHAMCGDDFYDKFSTHAEVRDSYHRQQDSVFLREGASPYEAFEYGGIMWENYRGAVGGTAFVPTADCRFFVNGVPGLFIERYAPADYVETVNTMGLPRYAKSIVDKDDKGVEVQAQSNPIALCTRPLTLRRGFTSN